MPICRTFIWGATGLEPATSGVTGRVRHGDAGRRTAPNGLICRHFSRRRRPRSALLSQSSNRRLGHEWATRSCLHRQHRGEAFANAACFAERRFKATSSPCAPIGNLVAAGWQRFSLISVVSGVGSLRPTANGCAPLGSIKAPSWCVCEYATRSTSRRGSSGAVQPANRQVLRNLRYRGCGARRRRRRRRPSCHGRAGRRRSRRPLAAVRCRRPSSPPPGR